MVKEKIKLIMELIFIFIIPLILLTISIDFKTVKTYDTNNNELTKEKTLKYDNLILNEYLNPKYSNYLDYNQQMTIMNSGIDYYAPYGTLINGTYKSTNSNNICGIEFLHNFISGHKYYICIEIDTSINSDYLLYITDSCLDLANGTFNNGINIIDNIFTSSNQNKLVIHLDRTTIASINQEWTFNKYYLIDLTQMFGSGYEPINKNEIELIINKEPQEYITSKIITIKSNNIISENNSINYTPIGVVKNVLTDALNINNTITINIIYDYTILWIIMFILWHIIYGLFELIFHVIPKGRLKC